MSFTKDKFNVTGGQSRRGNAAQTFSYNTSDALTMVATTGYFNDVKAHFEIGDTIDVYSTHSTDGGTYTYYFTAVSPNVSVDLVSGDDKSILSPFVRSGTTIIPVNAGDDLDMGTGDITTTGEVSTKQINFDITNTDVPEEGELNWNSDDGTLQLGMPGGNVKLQVGEEQLIRVKASENITNGQLVYIDGSDGSNPTISLANAGETNGSKTLAMATEDITSGQQGYVTTFGLVRDVNTDPATYTAGDEIFLDNTDGDYTIIKLDHPNFRIKVGYVLRAHASEGVVFINIKGDQWLKRFQSMVEPTGFDADQTDLRGDMSFTNTSPDRTFQIEPVYGQTYFNFWISGREYRKSSAETLQITDTEGLHYIYYDSDGVLQEAVNPSDATIDSVIRSNAIVSVLYWDATNNEYIWFNEERHLNQMDGNTHSYLHFTRGTQWLSGGALGDFDIGETTNNSGAQFSYSTGSIADEDRVNFESNIASTVGNEILYLDNGDWRRITETGYSVLDDVTAGVGVTGRLVYNDVSTPGSETLATVTNNRFVLCHILQTNGYTAGEKVFAVVGQNEYLNLNLARIGANTEVNNLITTGLPGPEFIFLGSVIFQTNDAYGNAVKATVRATDLGDDYVDWRTSELSPSSPGTNHSALSGLTNDDHLQYELTNDRMDTKGDLTVHNGTNVNRFPVGTDGYVLTADSSETEGIKWAAASTVEDGTAAGQMLFWDGTSQWDHTETTELFWDDTNKGLIVGYDSATITIAGTSIKIPFGLRNESWEGSQLNGLALQTPGFSSYNYIFAANGTLDSPTVVTNLFSLGGMAWYGHDGDDFFPAASLRAVVDGTVSANTIPVRLDFRLREDSSNYDMLTIKKSEIVFNEDSVDCDFRIESDTLTHAFFVQGSDGFIGINYSTPDVGLCVDNACALANGGDSSALASTGGNTPWRDLVSIGEDDNLILGTQGSFRGDLTWNWYRNTGGTATVVGINSSDTACQISMADEGIYFRVEDSVSTGDSTVLDILMYLRKEGEVWLPQTYGNTTGSSANMYIDSNGELYRSTSSLDYKKDVEDILSEYSERIYDMRPVWYRSTCEDDNKNWGYWGLIAEELDLIDKRCVSYGYKDDAWELVDGERVLKKDAELKPDGVQYTKLIPLIIKEMQKQKDLNEELLERIKALESK